MSSETRIVVASLREPWKQWHAGAKATLLAMPGNCDQVQVSFAGMNNDKAIWTPTKRLCNARIKNIPTELADKRGYSGYHGRTAECVVAIVNQDEAYFERWKKFRELFKPEE